MYLSYLLEKNCENRVNLSLPCAPTCCYSARRLLHGEWMNEWMAPKGCFIKRVGKVSYSIFLVDNLTFFKKRLENNHFQKAKNAPICQDLRRATVRNFTSNCCLNTVSDFCLGKPLPGILSIPLSHSPALSSSSTTNEYTSFCWPAAAYPSSQTKAQVALHYWRIRYLNEESVPPLGGFLWS